MLANLYTPTQTHYHISFWLFVWHHDTVMVHCEQGHDLTKTWSECKQIIFTKKGMWYMNNNFLSLWLRSITAVLHHFVAAVLVEILTICAASYYLQTRKSTTSSPNKIFLIHNVHDNYNPSPLYCFWSLVVCCCVAGEGSGFKIWIIHFIIHSVRKSVHA